MNLEVLYEDNHVIAVYKPAGIPAQEDASKDPTLMDEVKWYLKNKYNKPGKVFLGLIHRLDRPVSGIMLFAKTSKGASRLSEQFRNRTVQKMYQARVEGVPKETQQTLVHYLKKNTQVNKTEVYDNPKDGALRAELSYEVVEIDKDHNALIKIQLKTGRPHQIRAQFSAIGHPILGDVKYGAKSGQEPARLALVATDLVFETATGGQKKHIHYEPLRM